MESMIYLLIFLILQVGPEVMHEERSNNQVHQREHTVHPERRGTEKRSFICENALSREYNLNCN